MKKEVSKITEGEDRGKLAFRGKLKYGMKVSMFLEHAWLAQEWLVEKKYMRVLFNKMLPGDEFGITPPSTTTIKYTEAEALLLKKSMEAGKKKKGRKATKKPKCSPLKGKRVFKDTDDEKNTFSSSASNSDKTLSADLDVAAKATYEEEEVEAPGADAQ